MSKYEFNSHFHEFLNVLQENSPLDNFESNHTLYMENIENTNAQQNEMTTPDVTLDYTPPNSIREVCVLQRGNISKKMIKLWEANLSKKTVKVFREYSKETAYIILDEHCDKKNFIQWSKEPDIPSVSTQFILTPSWMIDFLKTDKTPNPFNYIHSLQAGFLNNSNNSNFVKSLRSIAGEDITRNTSNTNCATLSVDAKTTTTTATSTIVSISTGENSANNHNSTVSSEINAGKEHNSKRNFACISSGNNPPRKDLLLQVSSTNNPNKLLIDIFSKLQEIYDVTGDQWRAKGYKTLCNRLENIPFKILTVDDIKTIKGIGSSMLEKIQEILETGELQLLTALSTEPKIDAIKAFSAIWGVGPQTAQALADKGYRSIEELRKVTSIGENDTSIPHPSLLTSQQLVGLKCYEEFQQRIPRSEVTEIERVVTETAERLLPGVQCIVCGSYRRGKTSSGDVDVLIGPPSGIQEIYILPQLILELERIGFITDHLALPDMEISADSAPQLANHRASYMGVCKLPREGAIRRRLDLKTYPRLMFPFALLYFTGSDHFNRSMRLYADKVKGMTLSDKGLRPCQRDPLDHSKIVWKGNYITCSSEKEIFDILELPYKEPVERNCDDLGNTS